MDLMIIMVPLWVAMLAGMFINNPLKRLAWVLTLGCIGIIVTIVWLIGRQHGA